MDYAIVWTESAIGDLRELVRYIAADDPIAAGRFGEAVIRQVESLKEFPRIGRVVPELGDEQIREIILAPYRVVYELVDSQHELVVIRIWHGARGEPDMKRFS